MSGDVGENPEGEAVYVAEGWWHPNCKDGQVHEHPEAPGRNWSVANHRLCEQVFTRRGLTARETSGRIFTLEAALAELRDDFTRIHDIAGQHANTSNGEVPGG